MDDLKSLLPIVTPVLGCVSAVLGLLVWLVRHQLESKNEQIKRLEEEKKSLETEVARKEANAEREEANAKRYQVERDEAVRRRDDAERAVTPLKIENANLKGQAGKSDQYLALAKEERGKRQQLEMRLSQLDSDLQNAHGRVEKAEAEAKNAIETAAKRTQAIELSLQTALRLRTEAEKKAADTEAKIRRAQTEIDRLIAMTVALEQQIESVANQDGRVWETPLRPGTPPFVPLADRQTPIVSLLNLKGGVGKTTLTGNIAAFLSEHQQKRVLVIDLDHQRSLSQLLLSPKERELATDAGHTVQRFLRNPVKDGPALLACSRPVPGLENVRVITNTDPRGKSGTDEPQSLDDLEMRLMSAWLVLPRADDVRFLLLPALQSKTIQSQFDYVLIDCPPRLTTACINALVASDYLLIPTQAEPVALSSVYHLIRRLLPLRERGVVPELKVLGIVANMVRASGVAEDSTERKLLAHAAEAASLLWGREVCCFETLVRRHDQYAEASRQLQVGEPLRMGIYYKGVRDDVTALVKEIRSVTDHESSSIAAVPS